MATKWRVAPPLVPIHVHSVSVPASPRGLVAVVPRRLPVRGISTLRPRRRRDSVPRSVAVICDKRATALDSRADRDSMDLVVPSASWAVESAGKQPPPLLLLLLLWWRGRGAGAYEGPSLPPPPQHASP